MTYYDETAVEAMPWPNVYGFTISNLGTAYANAGGAMSDTMVAGGIDVGEWAGEASDAVKSELRVLTKATNDAAKVSTDVKGKLDAVGEALSTLATKTIGDLHRRWNSEKTKGIDDINNIIDEHNENHRLNSHDPDYICPCRDYEDRITSREGALKDEQESIVREYVTKVNEVTSEASSQAAVIMGIANAFVPEDKANRPGRNDISVHLFGGGDSPILESQARMADADFDSERVADIIGSDNPTAAELEELAKLLDEQTPGDPFFAAALLAKVSPEELMDYVAKVEGQLQSNYHMPDSAGAEEFAKDIEAAFSDIGASVVVGTGGGSRDVHTQRLINLFNDTSDAYSLKDYNGQTIGVDDIARQWRDDMREAGQKYYYAGGGVPPTTLDQLDNPVAAILGFDNLGLMMGLGLEDHPDLYFGDEFIAGESDGSGSVARDIIKADWDRAQHFPDMDNGDFDAYNLMRRISDDWHHLDSVEVLLRGMDGNWDATETFLASDTPFDYPTEHDDHSNNMTRYLVSHRPGYENYPPTWADGGEQLGQLVFETSRAQDDVESGTIALGFLQGYTDGLYETWGGNDGLEDGQDPFGARNRNLRSWAGPILAPYIDDIAAGIHAPDDGNSVVMRDGEASLKIDSTLRSMIIGEETGVSSDDHGADRRTGTGLFQDLYWDQLNWDPATGTFTEAAGVTHNRPPALMALVEAAKYEAALDVDPTMYAMGGLDPADAAGLNNTLGSDFQKWADLLTEMEMSEINAQERAAVATDSRNSVIRGALELPADIFPPTSALKKLGLEPNEITSWVISRGFDAGEKGVLDFVLPVDHADDVNVARGEVEERARLQNRDLFFEVLSRGDSWTAQEWEDRTVPLLPNASPQVQANPNPWPEGMATPQEYFGHDGGGGYRPSMFDDGVLKPYSEMNPQDQAAFRDYITEGEMEDIYGPAIDEISGK